MFPCILTCTHLDHFSNHEFTVEQKKERFRHKKQLGLVGVIAKLKIRFLSGFIALKMKKNINSSLQIEIKKLAFLETKMVLKVKIISNLDPTNHTILSVSLKKNQI